MDLDFLCFMFLMFMDVKSQGAEKLNFFPKKPMILKIWYKKLRLLLITNM